MAKNYKKKQAQEQYHEEEMTKEQAQEFRESLFESSETELSENEKREQFRIFWAQNKSKYGKTKEMENVIWLHIKSAKLNNPEDFKAGIKHFGLSEI
jgi:hypothetical protein